MKITYLHQYFNTPSMSGGTRSYEMGRRLVQRGHEVHVVTSWREPTDHRTWFHSNEDGLHVHWFPVPYSNRMSYARRIRAFVSFAVASARKAAALGGDVVLATSTPLTIAIPGVFASRWTRRPMVFEVRDLWPELPIAVGALSNPLSVRLARWLERFAYRNSRHIIALSPGMRDGVAATGYPSARISVIPNACDLELFSRQEAAGEAFRERTPWLRDRPLVVYAGTLGKINGVGYLVDLAAAALSLEPELRFLVVGDGAEWEDVMGRARDRGVLDKTFFMMRQIAKADMPAVMSAATISTSLFIDLPAMRNNSANKFFDALAAGTPVAVNYRGWHAELLEAEEAGIVLDPRDPAAAAVAIAAAVRDRAWLHRAGANASRLAETRFDRDRLADELERALVRVGSERGPRPG